MNKVFTLLTISAVLLSPSLSAAENKSGYGQNFNSGNNQDPGGSQVPTQSINWLGVSLGAVPDVLRGQLGHLIPNGQGVLVMGVSPSSSAFKAGIGRNDVLLSYDDQKLYSPSQLSGLIRSDKKGREVRLQVLQKGVLKTLLVKLGSKQIQQTQNSSYHNWSYPPLGYSPFGMIPPPSFNNFVKPGITRPDNSGSNQQSLSWDSFESVQVNTLPDGRYHAEISYKDKSNETRKFSFEGKREEIIEQIKTQADLPDEKKKTLLNALNMRSGSFMGSSLMKKSLQGTPFMNHPFSQSDPFNSPFFERTPFNDTLKRGFQFDQYDFLPRNQRKSPPDQIKGLPEEVI